MSRLRLAAFAVLATLGLAGALVFRPGDWERAIDAYFLFLGALALRELVRATAQAAPTAPGSELVDATRERAPKPDRPKQLARLEREVSMSQQSAFDSYHRLRPVLREIAAVRLARRGVALDDSEGTAEELLGPEAWQIVRPGLGRPTDHFAPGVSLESLRAAIESLEKL